MNGRARVAGGLIGPNTYRDVRKFLHEATGVPIEGLRFERTPAGYMSMVCEFQTVRGEAQKKRLTMGFRLQNAADEVVDLAVMMSEWIENGEGHMMELLDSSRDAETVQ